MFGIMRSASLALVLVSAGLLSACGGGSGGGGSSSSSSSSGSSSGASSSSSSSGAAVLTCQQQFDPSKAKAGDDCTPIYGAFCPEATSMSVTNSSTVNACDGVSVATGTATANGLTSDFVVVTPATGGKSGTYLALHWALANGPTMVNRLRLSELAKGRDITVVAPTAPGPIQTWGSSVVNPTSSVADRIALLQAVLVAAKGGSLTPQVAVSGATPRLVVAGLSGGGIMAYDFGCANADTVTGIEIVAAEITPGDVTACTPSKSIATVQVHGTDDAVAPYNAIPFLYAGVVPVFQQLYANNGCVAAGILDTALPSTNPLISGIDLQWLGGCTATQSSALVTITGGGHNWPGMDPSFDLPIDVNGFGPYSEDFDATLQGYDLLTYLGG